MKLSFIMVLAACGIVSSCSTQGVSLQKHSSNRMIAEEGKNNGTGNNDNSDCKVDERTGTKDGLENITWSLTGERAKGLILALEELKLKDSADPKFSINSVSCSLGRYFGQKKSVQCEYKLGTEVKVLKTNLEQDKINYAQELYSALAAAGAFEREDFKTGYIGAKTEIANLKCDVDVANSLNSKCTLEQFDVDRGHLPCSGI